MSPEEMKLWRKQQAIQRKSRVRLALAQGHLTHKCLCACGLRFTTKGIAQHQRRCAIQQAKWKATAHSASGAGEKE